MSLSYYRAASAIIAQRLTFLAEMLGMYLALIGHVQTIGFFQRPLKIIEMILPPTLCVLRERENKNRNLVRAFRFSRLAYRHKKHLSIIQYNLCH